VRRCRFTTVTARGQGPTSTSAEAGGWRPAAAESPGPPGRSAETNAHDFRQHQGRQAQWTGDGSFEPLSWGRAGMAGSEGREKGGRCGSATAGLSSSRLEAVTAGTADLPCWRSRAPFIRTAS